MVERQERMLALLERGGTLTAGELADRLGVTPRTVRNYVAATNGGADAPVIVSGPNGYRVDPAALARYRELERDPADSPRARRGRVLRRLVDAHDPVGVHDLAAGLYVSESTIEADLGHARARLQESGLRLERQGDAVRVAGTEAARRRMLGALFREESSRGMLEVEHLQAAFATDRLAAFKTALLERLTESGYLVNDYGLSNVLLHVAVAVDRITRDHVLSEPDVPETAETAPLAGILRELVPEHFGIDLGEADVRYLASLIATRAATPVAGPAADLERFVDPARLESVRRIVLEATRRYLVDLDDEEFLGRLAMHVQHLVARAGEQSYARNPIAGSLKSSYPMIYELAVFIAGELQREEGIDVSEDEIAYIAMHVGARLEDATAGSDRIDVSVVVPAYQDLHLVALRRIREVLASDARIVDVITRSDVDWSALGGEVVVTTVPERRHDDRAIVVTPFVGDDDLGRVRSGIAQARRARRRGRLAEELLEYFDPELFRRSVPDVGAEGVIQELGREMVERGIIDDAYVEGALERERLSSTAFTEHLAVPHAMAMTARRTAISIVVSPSPLRWGDEAVQVVALIAFSEEGRAAFQRVFDQFVEVFSEPDHVRELVAASTDFPSFIDALSHVMES
ncbi:BglG family transcription antiterminator [Agromyces mangrovi Wang et al. 2018]|uniref:BglG family transcription antiterminator n=1 Tax=Agromyces mangrovi TaxID=1858653 RepID=UPI0025744D10|nr:PTS sugar transporter subunit IIA [Agromyces mangrovi]BDZ63864.1 transcriptional antiterminator [Agromyces mangrovi]